MLSRAKFLFCIAVSMGITGAHAADLRVALNADRSQVVINSPVTYTLTVTNPTVLVRQCIYDPETRRPVCEMVPTASDANNVSVSMPLPAGAALANAFTDQGNSFCAAQNGVVTCALGSVRADTSRRATIVLTAPGTAGTMTATATVDQGRLVAETNENNNTSAFSISVTAPPPGPLPDLAPVATATLTSVNYGFGPIVNYDVWVNNLGDAPADNVVMHIHGNFPFGSSTASAPYPGGWSCFSISGTQPFLHMQCSGGSIAPNSVAHFVFSASAPTSGLKCLTAVADPLNTIVEKDLFGNTTSACVNVP